jgi:hypothetical protein
MLRIHMRIAESEYIARAHARFLAALPGKESEP